MSIGDSLRQLQEEIHLTCERVGRNPQEITLIAVSKTHPANAVREAYAAGQRCFGENRVQDLVRKVQELPDLPVHWHLVGSLQTNKVRAVVPHVELIHSVDREGLVAKISAEARAMPQGRPAPGILVQVNTTGEASKSGVSPSELPVLLDRIRHAQDISLRGLMTIGPRGGSAYETQVAFALLRTLWDQLRRTHRELPMEILSMGMSDDFPMAIAEGSTHLRIGSRIFGARPRG